MVMNNCPVADVYGLLHGSVTSQAAHTKEASRAAGEREREQSFTLGCRCPVACSRMFGLHVHGSIVYRL